MTWPTSNPIARELNDFHQETQSLYQQWWYEADIDVKMATGQQNYMQNIGNVTSINFRNSQQLQFNKILRMLNMISGYQIDNRLATVIQASDNDPDLGETADQRTTVLNWVKRADNTYTKISDCFAGSNMCGFNLQQAWMDFREDPENGTIRTTRLPFSSFIADPYWVNPDFSDCRRLHTRRYVTKQELISLVPDIKNNIPALGKGFSAKDGKFQYLPQNWYQYQMEQFAYDEYWKLDTRTKRRILDKNTGEVIDWKGTRDQFRLFKRHFPNIELINVQVPTAYMYILVNNQLIYEEKTPFGLDRLPFIPYTCYMNQEVQNYGWRYYGIPRNVRDSQIELNKRRNRQLDMLDAQVQSGMLVKEDALVNPEDAYKQGPGSVMFFKNTANLATDAVMIQPPSPGPGWQELIAGIEKEIMDIVGPEELFAQNLGNKEMSGLLLKMKMGAGLTGLRNIFDKLNQSQMALGELIDDLVINNFSEGHVARILGKEPSKLFFDKQFSRFNCVCEEGELTSTQRQFKLLQAIQLKQLMPDAISDDYILSLTSLQDKKTIIEQSQQKQQQAQQMQQMQFQSQMAQEELLTRSLEAKAQNDFAAAEERKARAVSDIALAKERSSQAVHDRASAALENAKALHEMQDMSDDRLIKLANFIIEVEARQKAAAGGEEGDSALVADAIGSSVKNDESDTKPAKVKQMGQSALAGAIS
jgi:hypothetical protein